MQNKLELLKAKEFLLNNVKHKVKEVKVVTGNAVVITDRKIFNLYPSELDPWLDTIEIIDLDRDRLYEETIKSVKAEANIPERYVAPSIPATVIASDEMTSKVADKLFEMFEVLSKSPTEANYKQATAMKEMSNAIMNTQIAKLKFLTLKQQ